MSPNQSRSYWAREYREKAHECAIYREICGNYEAQIKRQGRDSLCIFAIGIFCGLILAGFAAALYALIS